MAIDGKIIIGVEGGEGPVRGFLDAYDAKNGKQLWRLYTVLQRGEPCSETRKARPCPTGGTTWGHGSYDPEV